MKYIIKKSQFGQGLFAEKEIKKGELIGIFQGTKGKNNTKYTLWVDDVPWLIKNDLKFINHSQENPNSELYGFELYSLTKIKKGEELFFDYGCGCSFDPFSWNDKSKRTNRLLKQILRKKNNINVIDQDGQTILHYICRYDFNIKLIKKLLKIGIDFNALDYNNKKAIDLIESKKNKKLFKNLIHS